MKDKQRLLSLYDVSFGYGAKSCAASQAQQLSSISFDLYRGETLGVIGSNGAGKSTLLRLLAGVLSPSSGRIDNPLQIRLMLLSLGVGFMNDLTGEDNVRVSLMLQGFSKSEIEMRLPEVREFAELGSAFGKRVKTYSSGMRSRLTFSTALFAESDVLLIDEVLAVGDGQFKKKASEALRKKVSGEQTVVLVSHSDSAIKRLCDRALWIEGGVVKEVGDVSDVLDAYQRSQTTDSAHEQWL